MLLLTNTRALQIKYFTSNYSPVNDIDKEPSTPEEPIKFLS